MNKKFKNVEQNLTGAYHEMDTTGCSINCNNERIRKRAYELYLARGGAPGRSLDDWLQAEREISHHLSARDRPGTW